MKAGDHLIGFSLFNPAVAEAIPAVIAATPVLWSPRAAYSASAAWWFVFGTAAGP